MLSGSNAIWLIGAPYDRVALREAGGAVGATVAGEADWASAPLTLPDDVQVVVAALVDLPDDALSDALARLSVLLEADDIDAVVTLSEQQIDAVAGILLGRRVELLCQPDAATLVGAIALALARRSSRPPRTLRSDDAERLRRLHEEVARIAGLLVGLTDENDGRPGGVADRSIGYGAPASPSAVTAADIRRAIRARRLRDAHFAEGLFEDPAWDILLDLYAAHLEGRRVSVSSLCIAAAVAPTTALRWIARMSDMGLLERHPDPSDRRRVYLMLSDVARGGMAGYFGTLAQNGLAIA